MSDDQQQWRMDWQRILSEQGLVFPVSYEADLWRVGDASEFVTRQIMRQPLLLLGLLESGLLDEPRRTGALADDLACAILECQDENTLAAALRQFRNREMVRIIWRDIAGLADLDETLEDLSELADQCIRQGLAKLSAWAITKSGAPRDADGQVQELIVLGMGKLGARELNMSSDIDLIFCYPSRGQTDGRRALDNETYFTRLGRSLIKLLGQMTADGFAFRVDMRLRPFGDAGPLVVCFDAMEQYLQTQARGWERYALIKARAITGSADEQEKLYALLRAFVYRRYIDYGVIESIRDMKQMIGRELQRQGMEDNIKLGRGGIREIEFIGQAMQLVRGGREHALQARPIQTILNRLAEKQWLPDTAVQELLAAYRFLRRVENHIQAWRDEQKHTLPAEPADQTRLARSLGFSDWLALQAELNQHRNTVQHHFEQVFAVPETGPTEAASLWLSESADSTGMVQILREFRDSAVVRTLSANARGKLDQLMPTILTMLQGEENAETILERTLRLFEAIMRRTAYLDLLNENPSAMQQLLRLLRESIWIGSQLAYQPLLLDELLNPDSLYSPLRREALAGELAAVLASVKAGDLEQEMERLREFAQGNRLRVAAADVTGAIPVNVVSDYLTEIAEIVLQQIQHSAWRDLTERHGSPTLPDNLQQGFAVIGYGKLGGIELGYGSDLDLVFLHGASANGMTGGARSVPNEVFYARLVQRIIHMLSTRTPSGQLYEVDLRLRPNGNAGMLVSSMRTFVNYQQKNAWTWEHQALTRARPICGDPEIIAQFDQTRREILCRQRDIDVLRQDVCAMRQKMAASLDKSDADFWDVKQGAGGLVDIEFLVQYAVLRWAHEYPALTEWTDNARLLERLVEYQLLEGESAELLLQAYRGFRAIVHRNTLQEQKALLRKNRLPEESALVKSIWRDMLACE